MIIESIWSSHDTDAEKSLTSLLDDCTTKAEKRYVREGFYVGRALSFCDYGIIIGLKRKIKKLIKAEREYARLGYRIISIDDFIECGGWGKSIDSSFRQKLGEGEEPTLYAENLYKKLYPRQFLGFRF